MIIAAVALGVALVISLGWRSAWAPATGALVGLGLALAGGVATRLDVEHALGDLWRPMISIAGIMGTTSSAAELGIFTRLAAWIEPRTRGPVKHACRLVFAIAALTAAILSNDAAILLLTPVVIELLRAVYPRRNPKFLLPFAFAAFVAAGVAPLPTGNPMNLVVAYRAGIDVNTYALHMVPVALAGWLVAYAMLAWCYRDALADQAPALGAAPPIAALTGHARLVLFTTGASIASYPNPRGARPADLAGRLARGADLHRGGAASRGAGPPDRPGDQLGAVAVPVRRAGAGDRARPGRGHRQPARALRADAVSAGDGRRRRGGGLGADR